MRTILLAVSVLALVTAACSTETDGESGPVVSGSAPKKGTTTHPGATNTAGEHGTAAPAGDNTGDPPAAGEILTTDTWADGKTLSANATIGEGQTITISPGATVNVAANVTLTIKGTLKVASTATHAKMTGTSWGGLIVASGGTLDADGLDLTGSTDALWTQAGDTATFKNGVINTATAFKMEAGSKLTIDHTTVKSTDASAIAGTFVATFLTYDKAQSGSLIMNDPAGTMTISDSAFTGTGGSDYLISDAGHSLSLSYSTVGGSHCGLHFASIDQFSLDHVSIENNSYGFMLYGSGAGPNTITSSNFRVNNTIDIDRSGTNGPLTITKSFLQAPTGITPTSVATVAVPDAQPRQ